jgi:dTDP-4-dehydrorhamnose 3,5-epimerase
MDAALKGIASDGCDPTTFDFSPGVVILEPQVFGDERGFFLESYNQKAFAELGIAEQFLQDNHSSSHGNVLRGLHYQIKHAQGKLVRVVEGDILDVAVDVRRSSPTFGECEVVRLSGENKRMLWIPAGFADGFRVCSEKAHVLYKATDYYAPEHERTLIWNDPDLKIEGTGRRAHRIDKGPERPGSSRRRDLRIAGERHLAGGLYIITERLFRPLNPKVAAHSGLGPASFICGKRCTRFSSAI